MLDPATGRQGQARSASFQLPNAVATLVRSGVELGAADDRVLGRTDSGKGTGTVGHLTRGIISRTSYYEHTVTLALIPFLWEGLYEHQQSTEGSKV